MARSNRKISRVGIDTGGTFTDVAWLEDGVLRTAKVPSRPDNPSDAVLEGLDRVDSDPEIVCHGTTVGTNAVLARHGGPCCMVVTTGFRDVLKIGRGERRDLYSPDPSRHNPLVPPDFIFEVPLRPDSDGKVLSEPSEEQLEKITESIKKSGAEAVAVGILHSAAHPGEEFGFARKIEQITGIKTFASSSLSAFPREYERWSLTSLAAYLSPVLGKYLDDLADRCPSRLSLMMSSGGLAGPDQVSGNPSLCVLSGPAGGAIAALRYGRERVLALDMGGTSTDVTLLNGKLPRTRTSEIDNLPLPLPTIDIHTIGAGGGSIVKIDSGGMLRIGPESAGAMPGPACYGYGGPLALSDIALLAGRLVPDLFLGGDMKLHRNLSEKALGEILPDNLDADSFIDGVIELAIVHLTGALRKISVARGIDPAIPSTPYTLIPFGGAGALFAVECARSMGLTEVLHPPAAGVLSAIGLLHAPLAAECERSILCAIETAEKNLDPAIEELQADIKSLLSNPDEEVKFTTVLECRYRGQTHTMEIILPHDFSGKLIQKRFEHAYMDRFSYLHQNSDIEIVTVRIRGEIPVPGFELPDVADTGFSLTDAENGHTSLRVDGSWFDGKIFIRNRLPVDCEINGPCLVADDFSTLYLAPDSTGHRDRKGNLVIELI